MDLLHSGKFEGFCIVSSDSDFTRLASRIREEGLLVYGFGEEKTPKSFIAACDRFTYTEILRTPGKDRQVSPEVTVHMDALGGKSDLAHHIVDAVESCANEDGWAPLARVGSVVSNHIPEFDPRHYGHSKLSALVESTGLFEMQRRGKDEALAVYVKLKPKPTGLPAQP